jgi:hypothetical protein
MYSCCFALRDPTLPNALEYVIKVSLWTASHYFIDEGNILVTRK